MNDKSYRNLALLIGGAIVLYWIFKNKAGSNVAASTPLVGNVVNPELATYAGNPTGYGLTPSSQVAVTIDNQGMNYLNSNYIPLFGFVGMAQGTTW